MKVKFEKLTQFQQVVFRYVQEVFLKNEYEIKLDGDIFDHDGYVAGCIIIGSYPVRCSINRRGYICWHSDNILDAVLDSIPHFVKKICAQTKRDIEKREADWKKNRIKELQAELKQLKGE